MIKVLIVEDSPAARELLGYILSSDPKVRVVGSVESAEDAIDFLSDNAADVITVDINLPGMDGFALTKWLMETRPMPIVIISASYNPDEVEKSFKAMEAGALAILEKPAGLDHPNYETIAKEIVQTTKLMSEVKVVRRWNRTHQIEMKYERSGEEDKGIEEAGDIGVVAIGASTGGPPVIQTILSGVKKGFPAPILIVQHISSGFLRGFVGWLSQTTGFPVEIGKHGQHILPGHVYFAPDGFHMGVGKSRRLLLSKDEPENGLRPSVSYLFRSVAGGYGASAVGIILTGMGRDGAEELRVMRRRGAVTIAQDRASSVVHGMPGVAIRLDAARYILPPLEIARFLDNLADKKYNNKKITK